MTTYKQFRDQHPGGANRLTHMITFILASCLLSSWCFGWWTPLAWLAILGIGGRCGHYIDGNKPAFFSKPLEILLLVLYDGLMAFDTMYEIRSGKLDLES